MRTPEPHPEELPDHSATEEAPSAASQLFDLRTVIAILFIFYGVILAIMGLFFVTPIDIVKAGGININLWSGIVMILVAAGFFRGRALRPLAPPPSNAARTTGRRCTTDPAGTARAAPTGWRAPLRRGSTPGRRGGNLSGGRRGSGTGG